MTFASQERDNLSSKEGKYYSALDFLRGAAVLWVILHHIRLFTNTETLATLGGAYAVFERIVKIGYIGVDMFFVISGFLITGILIENWNDRIRLKRFYERRFLRIFPPYFAVLVTGLIVLYVFEPEFIRNLAVIDVLSYFVFIHNYVSDIPILRHFWSLAVEVHFYIIFSLAVYWVFNIRKTAAERHKLLMLICLLIIIAVNLKRYIFTALPGTLPPQHQMTFYRIDALALGCLLKLLEPFFRRIRDDFKTAPFIIMFTGILLYVYYAAFLNYGAARYWYSFLIAALAPACLVVAALSGVDRFLSNRTIQWCGRNCYSIYLWHYIVAYCAQKFLPLAPIGILISTYLCFTFFISYLFGITIEQYCFQFRKRIAP